MRVGNEVFEQSGNIMTIGGSGITDSMKVAASIHDPVFHGVVQSPRSDTIKVYGTQRSAMPS